MTDLLRCPICRQRASNVARGFDPFKQEAGAFGLFPSEETHILLACAAGHKWFAVARYDIDGNVTETAKGVAGSHCPLPPPKAPRHG